MFTTNSTFVQPITAFLSYRIYWNSSCDWLIGNSHFGTEIGGIGGEKITLYVEYDIFQTADVCTRLLGELWFLPGFGKIVVVVTFVLPLVSVKLVVFVTSMLLVVDMLALVVDTMSLVVETLTGADFDGVS